MSRTLSFAGVIFDLQMLIDTVDLYDQILEVTTKPMIVDADNGGLTEHFMFTVRTLERLGVSAVIIEDKIGPKRNSLFGTDVEQAQDTPEEFAHKIASGKRAQVTNDFMVIARIESLILKQGQEDAIARAQQEAGHGLWAWLECDPTSDPRAVAAGHAPGCGGRRRYGR